MVEKSKSLFAIKKVDPSLIEWSRNGKYDEIKTSVAKLKIGEAIEVECPIRSLGGAVTQHTYKTVKGNYRLRTKFNASRGVWYFMKTEK